MAVLRRAEPHRPPSELLEAVQAVASRIKPDLSQLQAWYTTYAANHAGRVAHDLAQVERFASPEHLIVDIGAAPYLLTATLQQRGYRVEGIDLWPERFASSIAALGLRIQQCDVETDSLPYESDVVDVLVLNEVFEHLRINPIATFAELHRILKPDGLLIMSTPNGLSLKRLVALCLRGRPGPRMYDEFEKLNRLGHMGHVREYAINEAIDFLSNMGFQPVLIIHRGRYVLNGRSIALLAADTVGRALPRLRPFFTVVAKKVERTGTGT